MRPTIIDGIMLVYNVAVLLSAGFLTMRIGIEDQWMLLGLAFALGIFWTIYFRFSMLQRVLEHADVPEADETDADATDRPL